MAPKKSTESAPSPELVSQARKINRLLADLYPDAKCELDFHDPLELLVATVLSAQCTDKRVNQVTPKLFAKYSTAASYAAADPDELEAIIKSTGFFRAKAKNIIALGRRVAEHFGGQVPANLDDLVTLPGVGRKTANVVLGNAFNIPGLTIDTHFGRLVRRFGWTTEVDPVKVESAIAKLIPEKEWTNLSHRLIWHGRRICHSRKPACGVCPLAKLCPAFGEGETDPIKAAKLVKSDEVFR